MEVKRVRKAGTVLFERMRMAAAQELKLPRDVVAGDVLVNFVGRGSVTVENYRSLLIYDESRIRLQASHCKINISGKNLHIDYYSHDEMKISGQIVSLEFTD